jgi:hypothetical protein
MHEHRFLEDGTKRASDNWKKGMPLDVYLQSMFRHFIDVWELHEAMKDPNTRVNPKMQEDSLMALLFNVQGYTYEFLKTDF